MGGNNRFGVPNEFLAGQMRRQRRECHGQAAVLETDFERTGTGAVFGHPRRPPDTVAGTYSEAVLQDDGEEDQRARGQDLLDVDPDDGRDDGVIVIVLIAGEIDSPAATTAGAYSSSTYRRNRPATTAISPTPISHGNPSVTAST
ncbi:hypothetical protein GS429_20980 [Natronorubrum sp. JWXQ-INN-674]|uniref:Uncharacterized protein n=1 Tax=Natronorubrum halalkaliphilum TaxID=2691917 RepID=A0A6B0VV61_9EURY|nr:hypothetical protein [Natronorubrum halalkaliphilum]